MTIRQQIVALLSLLLPLLGVHTPGIASAFTTTQNSRIIIASNHDARLLIWPLNAVVVSSSSSASADTAQQQLSPPILETLSTQGYVIVPNFLSQSLVNELRQDIISLRKDGDGVFKQAKIGQDATNSLNTDIRIAETCFLGRGRNELTSIASAGGQGSVRDRSGGLYDIIDNLRTSLDTLVDDSTSSTGAKLDSSLTELLYAYYPRGGYYRRHRDAIPNSASVLRKYSLLLYLNDENYDPVVDAGQLRLHLDGGGDECPDGVLPNYIDVNPTGGTLVLFKSELIPHEVLNTNSERYALVGWFNRGLSVTDIGRLGDMASGGGDNGVVRMGLLAVSMAMVTYGVANIMGS